MSGRIHDQITAENFAKWAEQHDHLIDRHENTTLGCAAAQFLCSLGFLHPSVGNAAYFSDWSFFGDSVRTSSPHWMREVVMAWDAGQRSGSEFARIARDAERVTA